MAKRNLSATIQIGAKMGPSVNSVFGGLGKKIDALGASAAGLKKATKDVESLAKATAKLDKLRTGLNVARKSRDSGAIDKARTAFEKQTAAVEKMRASLKAAGVDTSRLSSENERLARSTNKVQAEIARLTSRASSFRALKDHVNGVGAAFTGLRSKISGLGGLMAGAGLGAGAGGYFFKKQFIDTAAEFEKYRIQLAAFGDDSEKALKWSEEFAMQTPLNLNEVVKAYVSLRQKGLEPTDGTLQALVDSTAKSGKTVDDLMESIRQFGHAWGKEKLTAEDANIMEERGIPVYDSLAKALKKNKAQIFDLQKKGKLGRKEMMAMLFEAGKWSKGMSKELSGTWEGIIGRMGDYWVKFTKTVMESGPFVELKKQLEGFLSRLDELERDGTLKSWAEDTGRSLTNFIKEAVKLGEWLTTNIPKLAEFVGGWKNLAIVLGALALAPTIAALFSLGAAVVTLLGPWGLLAAAIATAAYALRDVWTDQARMFKEKIYEPIAEQIDKLIGKFKELWAWMAETSVGKWLGLGDNKFKVLPGKTDFGASEDKPSEETLNKGSAFGRFKSQQGPKGTLMPPALMPGAVNSGNVTNKMDIKIDARGMDAKQLMGELESYRSKLPKSTLYDQTGTLVPQ